MILKKRIWRLAACAVLLVFAGNPGFCGDKIPALTVMTHDSFSVSRDIVADFEGENGVKVRFLKAGHAGAALNQALLSAGNPLADVFYGVDNTFLSRAVNGGIFETYTSPMLKNIDDSFKLDSGFRLVPVAFGDICLNYDKKWFADRGMNPPGDLDDLLLPAYRGLTVVENPATSSPGLGFLLATVSRYKETGYMDFWKKLRKNDVRVTSGWKEAYWGHFTAASKGKRPIVVSYATSPAAEVHYAEKKMDDAPTAAVLGTGNAFRQIEFAGILKGTNQRQAAEKCIDFMLGRKFQEDIALQMFMFPVNREAKLPDVFVKYAKQADRQPSVAPDEIAENREKWIEGWTECVLR